MEKEEKEEEWVQNVYKAKVDSLPSPGMNFPILLLSIQAYSGPYSDGGVPGRSAYGRTVRRDF